MTSLVVFWEVFTSVIHFTIILQPQHCMPHHEVVPVGGDWEIMYVENLVTFPTNIESWSLWKLILSNGIILKESCNWIEFISVAQLMPDDTTESVATHSSRLQPTINRLLNLDMHVHILNPVTALMFGCSGTQIYDSDIRDECSGQPWDNFLGLKPVLHGWKAKVLQLDHRCLTVRPPYISLAK